MRVQKMGVIALIMLILTNWYLERNIMYPLKGNRYLLLLISNKSENNLKLDLCKVKNSEQSTQLTLTVTNKLHAHDWFWITMYSKDVFIVTIGIAYLAATLRIYLTTAIAMHRSFNRVIYPNDGIFVEIAIEHFDK